MVNTQAVTNSGCSASDRVLCVKQMGHGVHVFECTPMLTAHRCPEPKHFDRSTSNAIAACARNQHLTLRLLQHSELMSSQGDAQSAGVSPLA